MGLSPSLRLVFGLADVSLTGEQIDFFNEGRFPYPERKSEHDWDFIEVRNVLAGIYAGAEQSEIKESFASKFSVVADQFLFYNAEHDSGPFGIACNREGTGDNALWGLFHAMPDVFGVGTHVIEIPPMPDNLYKWVDQSSKRAQKTPRHQFYQDFWELVNGWRLALSHCMNHLGIEHNMDDFRLMLVWEWR